MPEPQHDHAHGHSCEEIVQLAAEYLEGVMTENERTEFELHLNFCEGCFRFVDQVKTTAAMADRLSDEQIPAELKEKLVSAFRDWRRN
jgi:anti-sigma factor (TIGR02949 family)